MPTRKAPFEFEPGSRWAYCNLGIDTLGRVIEVASGQSYKRSCNSIFTPLGMADTTYYPNARQLRIARAYDVREGKLVAVGYQLISSAEMPGTRFPPVGYIRPARTWRSCTG